jgi:hypothetical protein
MKNLLSQIKKNIIFYIILIILSISTTLYYEFKIDKIKSERYILSRKIESLEHDKIMLEIDLKGQKEIVLAYEDICREKNKQH